MIFDGMGRIYAGQQISCLQGASKRETPIATYPPAYTFQYSTASREYGYYYSAFIRHGPRHKTHSFGDGYLERRILEGIDMDDMV